MQQKLTQLTENIWIWPHNPDYHAVQSSVGLIVSGNETVMIDAGNSPYLTRKIKDELKQRGFPAVSRIIYTHHHWDHISGACEFQVSVVAHRKCRDILVEEAKKPWSSEYLHQEVERNPKLKVSYEARDRAIRNWETFRIVVPDTVFDTVETIILGQLTIELEHVGGEHAEDSIVARVPEAQVMFLGDCFYPPPLHLQTPESALSVSMLASLVDENYDVYIDSHRNPSTREGILQFLAGYQHQTVQERAA